MAMVVPNTFEESISETHLRALYALLPEALRENLYGTKFSKQLQTWRETLHPRGEINIRTLDGFDGLTVQVNLGDRLGCDIYYGFIQESWDYSLFMATLKPGDIVVDIGANFGMYALGAAKRLVPNGKVFAFEPDARSMSLLKENIRLNQFEDIVTCLDVCVGSYDGEVNFHAAADPSFSGIYDTNRSETTSHLNLPIRRLDSVMQELGIDQVNQIKIDVEGAEYEVLEGATEILANSDAIVMLEISSKNLDADRAEKLSAALERLELQGYVSLVISHEVTPVQLVFDESLKDIVRKASAGQTRNFFLVKRSGKYLDFIGDVFKLLSHDAPLLQESTRLLSPSHAANDVDGGGRKSLLLQREIGELDNLYATLWAERVEKHVAIDSSRKLVNQSHALESKLDETSKKLAMQEVETAAFKAKLVKASKELAAQVEYAAALKAKLDETCKTLTTQEGETAAFKAKLVKASKELAAQVEYAAALKANLDETCKKLTTQEGETAAFKAKLVKAGKELVAQVEYAAALKAQLDETSKKLTTQEGETTAFKAKLAEVSKELVILDQGFLGLLFRIKRRLLSNGAPHG